MYSIRENISRLTFVLLVVLLGGCGRKDSSVVNDSNALPEMVAVQQAFASAAPAFRNPVSQTLELVRAGKINPDAYREALPQLQKLAANPLVEAEQKKVLENLIERIKTELSPQK